MDKTLKNNVKISFLCLTNKQIDVQTFEPIARLFHGVVVGFDRTEPNIDPQYSLMLLPDTHPACYITTDDGLVYPHFGNARAYIEKELQKRYPDTDYIVWLDSDDDWRLFVDTYSRIQERLVEILNNKPAIVYAPYFYLKKNRGFKVYYPRIYDPTQSSWTNDPVHETLDYHDSDCRSEVLEDLPVYHLRKSSKDSVQRNVAILRSVLYNAESKKSNDGRLWYLLARDSIELDIDFSLESAYMALESDIAPHYRYAAHSLLSDIHWYNGDLDSSEQHAKHMQELYPEDVQTLLTLARIDMARGRYKDAAKHSFQALISLKNTKLTVNSALNVQGLDIEYSKALAYMNLLSAHHEMRDRNAVIALLEEIKNIFFKPAGNKSKYAELNKAVNAIEDYWRRREKVEKEGILSGLVNTDFAVEFIKEKGFSQKWPDKSIVIYAPKNAYYWDGASIYTEGAGGSETAVVEISKRLAKHGYDVYVFGNPQYACEVDGVKYLPHSDINLGDVFDTLVVFRAEPVYYDVNPVARKKFLWLQDVGKIIYYTPQLLERVDKILVLSDYHRRTLKHVPEDKIFYTTNGIDVGLIESVEKELGDYQRNYKKYIYASSPDRGLESLITMWMQLKKEGIVTDEELYWYYGWNSFKALKGSEKWEWMQEMKRKIKEAGIIAGGRIGKKQLYKEMFVSNHLLYPYQRPAETSCIVAMEAQATGLIPMTTGLDALAETQQWGVKAYPLIDYYESLAHVIVAYKNKKDEDDIMKQYRKDMMAWARSKYNWDTVVNDWLVLLRD